MKALCQVLYCIVCFIDCTQLYKITRIQNHKANKLVITKDNTDELNMNNCLTQIDTGRKLIRSADITTKEKHTILQEAG